MYVMVQQGAEAGRRIRLDRGVLTIGRGADCDWVLAESLVSRHHAELRRYGDQWLIVDLGSTHGTFVDEMRLQPEVARPLPPGEVVAIGGTRFSLLKEPDDVSSVERVPDWAAAAPPPPPALPSRGGIAAAWLGRALVLLGCGSLVWGGLSDWLRVQVRLPLVGQVLDRTFGGMDTGQAWLFIGVAAVAALLVLLDLFGQRLGLAVGLAQALLAVMAALVTALSFYRYYQVGTRQLWGISLLDILGQYAQDYVHLEVQRGIYLVAGGLLALIVGGLVRLIVAAFEPTTPHV